MPERTEQDGILHTPHDPPQHTRKNKAIYFVMACVNKRTPVKEKGELPKEQQQIS